MGTTMGRLFTFDPKRGKLNVLDEQAALFAQDRDGRLYFARDTELWQYMITRF